MHAITTVENLRIVSLNREMNEKMDTARENVEKVMDKTIELSEDKIELLNAYSRIVHCLSIKLAENHFELMHNAGKLAVMQSENLDNNLSPAYQEMKCTLRTRQVCLECLNETLDELNKLFDEVESNTTESRAYKVSSASAKPQTKEYKMSEVNEPEHEIHSTPRAKFV